MPETIETQGIILNIKPHGETSAVIDVFTQNAGRIKGYVKGARSKKNSGIYQKGNLISLTHSRRLSEQLGVIQADIIECLWQEISYNRLNFKIFNITCDLKTLIMPENVAEYRVYDAFMAFTTLFNTDIEVTYLKKIYIDYLLIILQQMGFSADFTRCAVSGSRENLYYVSPKSGNTICKTVGEAYHDKLLILPSFMTNEHQNIDNKDIDNAMKIVQLLFDKFIFNIKEINFNLII